jgi:hypothetical protein
MAEPAHESHVAVVQMTDVLDVAMRERDVCESTAYLAAS